MELTKLLLSDHPEKIKEVYETGISRYVSPAFASIPWQQAHIPAELPAVKYVRWAAFLRLTGQKEAEQVLRDLKLDNDTISKVKTLVGWSGRMVEPQPCAVRCAMSQMEPEVWDALLELNGYDDEIRRLTEQIRAAGDCLSLKELAVKGQDLIAAGVKPGKEMGALLHQLLEYVLEHPEENQKEILLQKLSQ